MYQKLQTHKVLPIIISHNNKTELYTLCYRQAQQMQVPVVSSRESWKRNKAKTLHKLKDEILGFVYIFALWRKTLQKIGGKPLTNFR